MTKWKAVVPLGGLVLAGCLASKGDIRLLQEEFRATRAQLGIVDTSIARANEQRRQQIASLQTTVDRLVAAQERQSDSLRMLASRLNTFQGNVNGELDALNRQMLMIQELLNQTTRNLQNTRAQIEQLQSQGPPSTAVPQTSSGGVAIPPGTPSSLTLFTSGLDALRNNAYGTARQSFDDLIKYYPTSEEAPRALLYLGDAYDKEGNKAAADSVFQLVPQRYPKAGEAPSDALWKRGKLLWDQRKTTEARTVFDRLIKDYPNSSAASLARDFLKNNRP